MSSAFESEVYAEQQRLPGVSVNLARLMQSMLWHQPFESACIEHTPVKSVSLTLEYRRDVDTSQWWTLRWGGEPGTPEGRFVAAKELELCLFRAAVLMRQEDERSQQYAARPTP